MTVCLDEMGPESAKRVAGRGPLKAHADDGRAVRVTQALDDGRRGKGDSFGAFVPATGAAFTAPYAGRTIVNWLDFLSQAEDWLAADVGRVDAILDNRSTHRALDVRRVALAHPRGAFGFPPKYAASLKLIEPWGKPGGALARKGRRFQAWAESEDAIAAATRYWNDHRHPSVWGRRRHRRPRAAGLAALPNVP